jgi:hypothetical protein
MVQDWIQRRRANRAGKSHTASGDPLPLPLSLRLAGWSIPIVLAAVGIVKTVTDMMIAAQTEVRARANTEITFFDRQYQYVSDMTKADLEKNPKAPQILHASVTALLSRGQPMLKVNWVFDGLMSDDRDRAMTQVCASRDAAFEAFGTEAIAETQAYFVAALGALKTRGDQPNTQGKTMADYDKFCLELKTKEKTTWRARTWARLAPSLAFRKPSAAAQNIAVADTDAAPADVKASPESLASQANATEVPLVETKAPAPGGPTPAAPTAGLAAPPVTLPAAAYAACAAPPAISDAGRSAKTHLTAGSPNTGWDIDIFWCGRPGTTIADKTIEAANYRKACRAFVELSANQPVGGETLGQRRLRRLPSALQDGIYYPQAGDVIRYDLGRASEQILGQAIGDKVWPKGYALQPSSSGTRWYLSMFACDGAAAK